MKGTSRLGPDREKREKRGAPPDVTKRVRCSVLKGETSKKKRVSRPSIQKKKKEKRGRPRKKKKKKNHGYLPRRLKRGELPSGKKKKKKQAFSFLKK